MTVRSALSAFFLTVLQIGFLSGADAVVILAGLDSSDAVVVTASINAVSELGAKDRARARRLVEGLVGDADPTRPKKIADDEVVEQAMIRLAAWDDAGTKHVLACATHRPQGDVRAVRALAWLGDRALPYLDIVMRKGDGPCAQTAVEAVESMTITDVEWMGAAIAILMQQALPEDPVRQELLWRAVGALLAAHPDIYNTRGAEMTLPALAAKWGPSLVVAHQQLVFIRSQDPMQAFRYLVNGTCDYFLYLAKDQTLSEAQRCAYLEGVLVVADKRRLVKAVEVLESLLLRQTSIAPWRALNTYLDRYLESEVPIGPLPALPAVMPPDEKFAGDERILFVDARERFQRVARLASAQADSDADGTNVLTAMPAGGWAQALHMDDVVPDALDPMESVQTVLPSGEVLNRLVVGQIAALNKARQTVENTFLATANRMQELDRFESGRLAQDQQRWIASGRWTDVSDAKPFGSVWLVRRQRNPAWTRILATIKHFRAQLDSQTDSARSLSRQMRPLETEMRETDALRILLAAALLHGLPVGAHLENVTLSLSVANAARAVAYPVIRNQRAYTEAAERRYQMVSRKVPRTGR